MFQIIVRFWHHLGSNTEIELPMRYKGEMSICPSIKILFLSPNFVLMRISVIALFICVCTCFSLFGQIPSGYYSSAEGKTGEALWTELNNIIKDPITVSYSQVDDKFVELGTDEDPNNSNNIIFFYMRDSRPSNSFTGSGDGSDFTGGWNKEHIWPRSRGVGDTGDDQQDMHMLRPTDVDVNARRGNLDFGLVSGNNTANGTYFEPHNEVKGDVARILFYMATCYKGSLELVENVTNSSIQLGNLSTLLQWHKDDPVSSYEISRNNKVYNYQLNRNPFVDHPEYVNAIWGNGTIDPSPTISTSAIIGGYNFGSVIAGNFSASISYKVTGANLDGDITVSVPSPFEISLNDRDWSDNVIIGKANAEENTSNTVFVRFSPTSSNGATSNESIIHTSSNASSVGVSVIGKEGEVTAGVATIVLNTGAFTNDFGQTMIGSNSVAKSYSVSANDLTESLRITAPNNFKISLLPSSGFSSSLILNPIEGSLNSTTIYVVFSPKSEGNQSGDIIHVSGGANESVSVIGFGLTPLSSESIASEINIYPNPTDGFVEITGVNWKETTVRIFDSRGYRFPVRFKDGKLDVSEFPAGMYYFTFTGKGNPILHKVILK